MDALIGHSGFVGSTLLRQRDFNACFRSTNIADVHGRAFDLVVCAAAPAQKWIANRDPEGDRATILGLIDHLDQLVCSRFVLISTVDVFAHPIGVDEGSPVREEGLHAYGLHRRMLETFVERRFSDSLIVRLPGLVGPSLRKNIIYDFLNDNNVAAIDSRGVFQFYPMVCLWADLQTALANGLKLVHLTAEPINVADVSQHGFGRLFKQHVLETPARYDFQTRYARLFGGQGRYQYTQRETLLAVRAYAQSEPRKDATL
jgi:hypothetical protein